MLCCLLTWFNCLPQKQGLSAVWSAPGLNIDLDNLLGSPKSKATSIAAPLSMNELASGGGGGVTSSSNAKHTALGSISTFSSTSAVVGASGPNYNISGADMGQLSGAGVGTGTNYASGGLGMGYSGSVGMRPQYVSGYGNQAGFNPMVPGMRPMGMGGMGQTHQRPF